MNFEEARKAHIEDMFGIEKTAGAPANAANWLVGSLGDAGNAVGEFVGTAAGRMMNPVNHPNLYAAGEWINKYVPVRDSLADGIGSLAAQAQRDSGETVDALQEAALQYALRTDASELMGGGAVAAGLAGAGTLGLAGAGLAGRALAKRLSKTASLSSEAFDVLAKRLRPANVVPNMSEANKYLAGDVMNVGGAGSILAGVISESPDVSTGLMGAGLAGIGGAIIPNQLALRSMALRADEIGKNRAKALLAGGALLAGVDASDGHLIDGPEPEKVAGISDLRSQMLKQAGVWKKLKNVKTMINQAGNRILGTGMSAGDLARQKEMAQKTLKRNRDQTRAFHEKHAPGLVRQNEKLKYINKEQAKDLGGKDLPFNMGKLTPGKAAGGAGVGALGAYAYAKDDSEETRARRRSLI